MSGAAIFWRYKRSRPSTAIVAHDTSRGVALYGDKVYFAAGTAVLVALDAKTGKEVWTTQVADNKAAYYISLAPLIAGGKVMVGSGGEFGVRGFVAAFDPETGKEQWRAYTIPAPGEPGSETWPAGGDQWKTGGGSVWVTGNYDPATNLAYWGTGNGGPGWATSVPATTSILVDDSDRCRDGRDQRPFPVRSKRIVDGRSVAANPGGLSARRAHRQRADRCGARRLHVVPRPGDATTGGRIKFIEGKPFVNQNVYTKLDPETGRPRVDPAHKPGTGKEADFCPTLHGGKNWPPIAFSPKTRMIYVPANNNLCGSSTGMDTVVYDAGKGFTGVRMGANATAPGATHIGEVQAWNVDTGKKVWTYNYDKSPNWGSMLATAGGLVFTGGT